LIKLIGVEIDTSYQSSQSQTLDVAWQLFHCGYISNTNGNGIDVWKEAKLPIKDEYRFIRKNYSAIWSWYVLVIRVLTLKNPFREVNGFWKARDAKRLFYAQKAITYNEYFTFKSPLLESNPLVSVIIPTLNRYSYLKDVLTDLENQNYKNFEVIIVDQSEPFDKSFYNNWSFSLRYWYQEEKALWKARNDAIQSAHGEFLLLYDDDSRVDPNWIEHHIRTLDFFQSDISSGVSISQVGAKVPAHYSYFRWSEQLDTGNVMIKRQVFEQVGLFDRQFEKQRMGDGEFGLRSYLAGFKNISNPYAKRLHLKVSEGGLRQMGSWDSWRPKNLFAPRPIPSALYLFRKYFGSKSAILIILVMSLPSIIPYKWKSKHEFIPLLIPILPILLPLLLIQVTSSWIKSGNMLKVGSLISKLEA
jgi:glycosyltransferase involved in cell wall biosynthesis